MGKTAIIKSALEHARAATSMVSCIVNIKPKDSALPSDLFDFVAQHDGKRAAVLFIVRDRLTIGAEAQLCDLINNGKAYKHGKAPMTCSYDVHQIYTRSKGTKSICPAS